ncbi:MAG: hypothetical protein AB4290_15535 [Spirulina sp.]
MSSIRIFLHNSSDRRIAKIRKYPPLCWVLEYGLANLHENIKNFREFGGAIAPRKDPGEYFLEGNAREWYSQTIAPNKNLGFVPVYVSSRTTKL